MSWYISYKKLKLYTFGGSITLINNVEVNKNGHSTPTATTTPT